MTLTFTDYLRGGNLNHGARRKASCFSLPFWPQKFFISSVLAKMVPDSDRYSLNYFHIFQYCLMLERLEIIIILEGRKILMKVCSRVSPLRLLLFSPSLVLPICTSYLSCFYQIQHEFKLQHLSSPFPRNF